MTPRRLLHAESKSEIKSYEFQELDPMSNIYAHMIKVVVAKVACSVQFFGSKLGPKSSDLHQIKTDCSSQPPGAPCTALEPQNSQVNLKR